ncbi:DUF1499 domain-containing protein [Hyphococcus sp.]|uniref:DUF1499 domain-containing protein n=1 Tax=Hyphococcus sp. TaxID=2038636 RepID=UPI003CCB915B
MRVLTTIVALAAFACALTIAIAGPGAKMGWWDYGTGFSMMRKVASPIDIIEGSISLSPIFVLAGLSLLGGLAALVMRPRGLGVFAILAAFAAVAAGMVPIKMRDLATSNPFIHDITTDFDNPPPIIAGADEDRVNPPEYVGDELVRNTDMTVAQAQREAFPELGPKTVNASLDETAEIVRNLIPSMNMVILDETLTDEGWLIEAAYTSFWYGFVDDFVVRLSPEGSQTRVDVRSKSRVGGSDLGANAKRVQEFFDKLDAVAP